MTCPAIKLECQKPTWSPARMPELFECTCASLDTWRQIFVQDFRLRVYLGLKPPGDGVVGLWSFLGLRFKCQA